MNVMQWMVEHHRAGPVAPIIKVPRIRAAGGTRRYPPEKCEEAQRLLREGVSQDKVAKDLKISRNVVSLLAVLG